MDLDGDSYKREETWNLVSRRIGLRTGGQITEGAQDQQAQCTSFQKANDRRKCLDLNEMLEAVPKIFCRFLLVSL